MRHDLAWQLLLRTSWDDADLTRIAFAYQCFDADRVSLVALVRAELERRVIAQDTGAYREDVVRAHDARALMAPYEELMRVVRMGQAFRLPTLAHQIAMFDVLDSVKFGELDEDSPLHEFLDVILGELVDRYGVDDAFYAYVRSSSEAVRARSPGVPEDLFDERQVAAELRTLVGWMSE